MMSDYHFTTHVLRDAMAEQLAHNIEQLPYVLAEVARSAHPSSEEFDEFCDGVECLDALQRQHLFAFFQAAVDRLRDEDE